MSTHDDHLTTWWTQPRAWRHSVQAVQRYWVEEEVLVLRGGVLVDRMSWSEPLAIAERTRYDAALRLKAGLRGDAGRRWA